MADLEKLLSEATPGPWTAAPDNREGMEWNRHVIDYDFNRVCFMAHNGGARPKNDEANARLVALAPDLAAALIEAEKALAKMIGSVCGETGFAACVRADSGFAYPWPALDEAEASARAALAKCRELTGDK